MTLSNDPRAKRPVSELMTEALALHRSGMLREAEALCEIVLGREKNNAGALGLLGTLHAQRGDFEEAIRLLSRSLKINRRQPFTLNSAGNALKELKRLDEALAHFDKAVALDPNYADAYSNKSNTLRDLGRTEEALAACDKAVALDPNSAMAQANRGSTLKELKRHDEALACYEKVVRLNPRLPYALGDYVALKMSLCDWDGLTEARNTLAAAVKTGALAATPYVFLTISSAPDQQRKCTELYTRLNFPPSPTPLWRGERYGHDRIRVGYFSADFQNHATAYLMAELFERHDRSRFEITAFSFGQDCQDEMRQRLQKAFDHWVDIRTISDQPAAELVKKLEIDIAVDLKGFTQGSRPGLFARRPAPLQIAYLGFPGTMGAPWIDYTIADETIVPREHEIHYSEKIARLPDTYQCNDSKRRVAERTPSRAEAGLPDSGFVFCCFNNNFKITPEMFGIWMRLLQAVEGGVLWLLEDNMVAARHLKREAQARGIAPERLIFAPRVDLAEHLARQRLADLFLDTLPYNAHTTASDALWVGLPVLTCLGQTFAGRVAASLVNAVGLPELVTHSPAEYEALALKLARDPSTLAALKAKLARNRETQPLFDAARFTRNLEAAYTSMWERMQRGETARSFSV